MRKFFLRFIAVCFFMLTTLSTLRADDGSEQAMVVTQARYATEALAASLVARLQSAIEEGGAVAGVEACRLEAQSLTQQTGDALGLTVGRTALRVRNPTNAPDDWEQQQLEYFEAMLARGTPANQLEALEYFDYNGRAEWRYMRPIMTGGQCLVCHGEQLAPTVANVISQNYPNDRAVDFKLGQLRGAFTVTLEVK